ncbi:hypothetical protein L3Y34_019404 [Caenorhabditis briggsae]|uniref:Uncharacterized protein n=1 Tax=Caenorhabditis briggsae TaxID=6238 RepID=A0AAE9IWM7_CAEBR|nr:hypothetical protein L3Y34_019404 [Caenorhabditis briggsae]
MSTSPESVTELLGEMKTCLVEFLDSNSDRQGDTKRNLDVKDLLMILNILQNNGVKVIENSNSSQREELRKLFAEGSVSDILHHPLVTFFSAWLKQPMAKIMLPKKN